jgi:hypothetical protein
MAPEPAEHWLTGMLMPKVTPITSQPTAHPSGGSVLTTAGRHAGRR